MIKIPEALHTETHISNCKDSIFTVFVHQTMVQNEGFDKIKQMHYIHALLGYPDWSKDTDIFSHIKPQNLIQLQSGKAYFVFDSSTEGFSPIKHFPFFDVLYFNCKKYNVNPNKIIYVSANFRDEENIVKYCKDKNLPPINVFSFSSFENVITKQTIARAKNDTANLHENKLFSSLSRVNRPYRATATYLLCKSGLAKHGLISHNNLEDTYLISSTLQKHNQKFNIKKIQNWCNKLPLIVDRSDFEKNWAIDTPHDHIHDSTIFQIVNETLVDDYDKTSLFYSEKTFRPVGYLQPFLIYGQQGCNRFLKNLGYKTYEDWFDLDFDNEPDNLKRYKKLLESVKGAVDTLLCMNKQERIEWKFKNIDILKHNHKVMASSEFSRNKLQNFLLKLQENL